MKQRGKPHGGVTGAAVKTALAAVVLAFFACGQPLVPSEVRAGVWGGERITLTVGRTGSTVHFCCAAGKIDQDLSVDASGSFEAPGEYQFEGGPIPAGGNPLLPARYSGTVSGSHMTLTVTLPSGLLGPFALTFGYPGLTATCVCPL